jgi:hypothetical protein
MESNFFTNFFWVAEVGRLLQASISFLKAERSRGREGEAQSPLQKPWQREEDAEGGSLKIARRQGYVNFSAYLY